ncbi:double-strand break repair helicase AddA [Hyphomicrobium sp.]|uniref:double-strand break repair helicase AddA n=1 Tax=Hyphomicrobium sp. TaxID=82 RepID=UPI002D777BDE|nr:double-strand break repair helicase AddA [Hyphomicrobium sp.]HET6388613.1 double-strand break repair helicase AddA [Hyphomicrobium sp.]
MNLETKRISPEELLRLTGEAQSAASDPQNSAWVNANAGTGKTHVLTLRVLRLLLAGTRPERILCLTFTKAAAAEMSKRVFDRLAGWVTASDDELQKDLTKILGRPPTADLMQRARTLFALAIETPGGLKVQTIHAFSERLLQRFPLEAGVPPDFKILDDQAARELKADAIEAILTEATGAPDTQLGKALDFVIRYAADAHFDQLISKAVEERKWLEASAHVEPGQIEDELAAMDAALRKQLSVRAAIASADLHSECANVLSKEELKELCELLATGTKTDNGHLEALSATLQNDNHQHVTELLAKYFLVENGEKLRASLMTKNLTKARPGLHSRCQEAQQNFFKLAQEARALTLIDASLALYQIAGAVLRRYAAARNSAGALDFDDLILKTRALLTSEEGQAQWVLFKLDGGLDHILVDEAQDTSPEQWEIISALAREFFGDTGAGTLTRTVFAVGDEKQSIYSFQGAAPKMFAEMGHRFATLATEANLAWKTVPLTLSFRTVAPVLNAVDRAFSDPVRTPGLTAANGHISHAAHRTGHAGLVEIWQTEVPDDTTPANPWTPLSDTSEQSPANRLADRIADTIKSWIAPDSSERLLSENRPIRAGDILILVRKRNPFAVPMVAALKRRGIPVAGSDRVRLTEQIAVQDLMVLGDFLTLPEDDLALATVLKSPLFNLTDDDLLTIAHGRKRTLWSALLDNADSHPALKDAAETLKRWRAKADFTPPFEFYSGILDRDGGREKMLNRLGPEAADVIDEFLDLALSYDESDPPSLTQFLTQLRAANPEVKRDMEHGRNEVRVMTVHGAKGLEAPIVFLPDTCTTSSGEDASSRLVKLATKDDGKAPELVVWSVKGTSRVPAIETARAEREAADREERNRLLYVAMTRARDRLYIAGFETKRGRVQGCWYDVALEALRDSMREIDLGDCKKIWRMEAPQIATPVEPKNNQRTEQNAQTRPDFATRRAPAEPKLSVPLAPSRLEPYAPDAEGEPIVPVKRDAAATNDSPSPLTVGGANRFLRGTITHALLQHLPSIANDKREMIATAFVERRGAPLPSAVRASIVKETLAVLADERFAPIFGSDSVAEAPIAAVIPRPNGKGPALDLSGQIDRLALTGSEVLIVDYKTNRPPPAEVRHVADAYLYQLAAYRLALAEIYPGRPVRAALLWTDGPRLMEIPKDVLDLYTARLWDLELGSLDAS